MEWKKSLTGWGERATLGGGVGKGGGKCGSAVPPDLARAIPATGLKYPAGGGYLTGFLGSFLHQLDEKGRIALPASYRRSVGEEGFVLIAAQEPALFLYPASSWSKVEEELVELLKRQPEARNSVLSITANAVEAVPDKQGRILIPERLQRVAELDGQALIVGALDKIEIWNPHLFESKTSEPDEKFGEFVKKIIV